MPGSHTNVPFVDAYSTTTSEKQQVPPHWLGPDSPFPGAFKTTPSSRGGGDQFDPSDHTVAEVTDYLDSASTTEVDRVIEAESAGKNRAGITGYNPAPKPGATEKEN